LKYGIAPLHVIVVLIVNFSSVNHRMLPFLLELTISLSNYCNTTGHLLHVTMGNIIFLAIAIASARALNLFFGSSGGAATHSETKTPPTNRTSEELAADAKVRRRARAVWIDKQKEVEAKRKKKEVECVAARIARHDKNLARLQAVGSEQSMKAEDGAELLFCRPVNYHPEPWGISNSGGLVAENGITRYFTIPNLSNSKYTASHMKRIAEEFMPIIHRRGFKVYSVSEMCCCGDALDTGELGGHTRHVRPDQKIDGHDYRDCGGYNRIMHRGRGKTRHTIHLRMRQPTNHDALLGYPYLVDVMCHELAHCLHRDHSESFYDCMAEIKKEHSRLTSGLESPENYGGGPLNEFNIYQSRSSSY